MNSPTDPNVYSARRQQMVDSQLRARGIKDERVLDAMARVPRHQFASDQFRDQSYEDHPVPIGEGQTISQPFIVALMLEALRLSASDKVLEIGTGSGYLTALLAELTAYVVSVERHQILAEQAQAAIAELGYRNVRIITGDGSRGLPEYAPYDVIVVSAAAPELPPELVPQLADTGRLIIPVGPDDSQQLQLVEKTGGEARVTFRELCRFVPLVPGKSR